MLCSLCWTTAGVLKSMSDMDVSWIGQKEQCQKRAFELCADYPDYGYVFLWPISQITCCVFLKNTQLTVWEDVQLNCQPNCVIVSKVYRGNGQWSFVSLNGTELQREFHNYILFVCMCKTELMPGITQVATMHLLYVDSMYTNGWRNGNMPSHLGGRFSQWVTAANSAKYINLFKFTHKNWRWFEGLASLANVGVDTLHLYLVKWVESPNGNVKVPILPPFFRILWYGFNCWNWIVQNLIMQHVDHSGGLLIDLLQGLLKFEPTERLTAKEALKHPFFREPSRRL
jgi:serine/threonine protein kinase